MIKLSPGKKRERDRMADKNWRLYQEYKKLGCPKSMLLEFSLTDEQIMSIPSMEERREFYKAWLQENRKRINVRYLKRFVFVVCVILLSTIIYLSIARHYGVF